jgi:hypothetical protein
MRLERGAIEKKLIGRIPREALKLVDFLPPVLAPIVLMVRRMMVLQRVRFVHRDQRTKRYRLEDNDNAKASLPFLELTLLTHRLQDESKKDCLLVSLHPQDETNQIRPLMLPVLSRRKKRVTTCRLSQWH